MRDGVKLLVAQVDPVYPMAHWQMFVPMHCPPFRQVEEQVAVERQREWREIVRDEIENIPALLDRRRLTMLKWSSKTESSEVDERVISFSCKRENEVMVGIMRRHTERETRRRDVPMMEKMIM